MYNKLDYQFLIMEHSVYANRQNTDELKKKLEKRESEFTRIKTSIKQVMVHNLHS